MWWPVLVTIGAVVGAWIGGILYDAYHMPEVPETQRPGGITVRQLLERERIPAATPPL